MLSNGLFSASIGIIDNLSCRARWISTSVDFYESERCMKVNKACRRCTRIQHALVAGNAGHTHRESLRDKRFMTEPLPGVRWRDHEENHHESTCGSWVSINDREAPFQSGASLAVS